MSFAADADVPWTLPPDWNQPVRETLAWLTDAMTSRSGVRQKRELRQAPRRTFNFQVLADAGHRRLAENLRFNRGGQPWLLPIWHDGQRIAADLDAGAGEVPCATGGYDFAVGSKAMLWRSPTEFEICLIEAITDDSLQLTDATLASWPAGTRLYPLRSAIMPSSAEESFFSDEVSRTNLQFQIAEPCDWPVFTFDNTYRDLPVFDERPDEPQNWTAGFARQLLQADGQTGPVVLSDLPGKAFRSQQTFWQHGDRDSNAAFRSFLYSLRGRMGGLWLPSWTQDLKLAADAGPGDSDISVEWCGYTLFGNMQPGRRDIRIDLAGGDVMYRRITNSVVAGATETLTLDATLDFAMTPAAVRRISFMSFSQLASDAVELTHVTDGDGLTQCTLEWGAADEL